MSSTKIFIIFGVSVCVVAFPLIIIYVWFPEILGRYDGLVTNIIVGSIGAFVVALALDFTQRRRQEKAYEKIAQVGISEASVYINRMLGLFAQMIKAASSGFIPSTLEELLSTNSMDLISLHLGLNKPAPVTPKLLWRNHLSNSAQDVKDGITSVQERYQVFFSHEVSVTLAGIRDNHLIDIFSKTSIITESDAQTGVKRPVLNIISEETTSLVEDLLADVKRIERAAIKLNAKVIPKFPHFDFRSDVTPKIGDARFDGQPGPRLFISPEPPQSNR